MTWDDAFNRRCVRALYEGDEWHLHAQEALDADWLQYEVDGFATHLVVHDQALFLHATQVVAQCGGRQIQMERQFGDADFGAFEQATQNVGADGFGQDVKDLGVADVDVPGDVQRAPPTGLQGEHQIVFLQLANMMLNGAQGQIQIASQRTNMRAR